MPPRRPRAPSASEASLERSDRYFVTSLCGATFLTAIIYLIVAIPLCWRFAEKAGKSAWSILLFLDVPTPPRTFLGFPNLASIGFGTDFDLSFWMALATAYGVLNLIVPLLLLSSYRVLAIVTVANGFLLGYWLTWIILRLAGLGEIPSAPVASVQILYIYLIFLVCEFGKQKIAAKNRNAHWLGMMVDGLFALAVSFLLSVGQQTSVELVAGPLFLVTSVFSMIVFEHSAIRFLVSMLLTLQALERQTKIRSIEGVERLRLELQFVFRGIKGNLSRSIDSLLQRFRRLWPKQAELSFSGTWEISPKLLVGFFLLNASFPVAATALWTAISRW